MIAKEFPNYQWIKAQSESAFQSRLDMNNQTLAKTGWPTVILNAQSKLNNRPNIKGPFSFFSNIKGTSQISAEKYTIELDKDTFFLTNPAQYYSLNIESQVVTEVFNIHFGEDFFEDLMYHSQYKDCFLLDNPQVFQKNSFVFFNRVQWKDDSIRSIVEELYSKIQIKPVHDLRVDELLMFLGNHLVGIEKQTYQQILSIQDLKPSTRLELFKRLSKVSDYIQTHWQENIALDELASLACLSKFHFLRVFKTFFKTTPHFFILSHKLQRAKNLIQKTKIPLQDIAMQVGIEEKSSFTRLFKKHFGVVPSELRSK